MSTSKQVGAASRRYATALFELARESQELESVSKALGELSKAWNEHAELRRVFENPAIDVASRVKVATGLADKVSAPVHVRRLVQLLAERQRVELLADLQEAFHQKMEASLGVVRATVVSAVELSEEYMRQLQAVLEQVSGKKVFVTRRVDPSVIGGVSAEIGDQVFDGTLRTRLRELKDQMVTR
jgi:F-type H+-transporting ATPase subunit delta